MKKNMVQHIKNCIIFMCNLLIPAFAWGYHLVYIKLTNGIFIQIQKNKINRHKCKTNGQQHKASGPTKIKSRWHIVVATCAVSSRVAHKTSCTQVISYTKQSKNIFYTRLFLY